MRNRDLARDHLRRATARLAALDVLYAAESWPDVVRESQEVVELILKGLLRAVGVEPPRVHDVGDVLIAEQARLPADVRAALDRLTQISRDLRRDRELALYGADDLTPSDFYRRADATRARDAAREVVRVVAPAVGRATRPNPTQPARTCPHPFSYESSSFEGAVFVHAHPAMPMAARPSRLRVTIFLPRPGMSGVASVISRHAARCSGSCADRAWVALAGRGAFALEVD